MKNCHEEKKELKLFLSNWTIDVRKDDLFKKIFTLHDFRFLVSYEGLDMFVLEENQELSCCFFFFPPQESIAANSLSSLLDVSWVPPSVLIDIYKYVRRKKKSTFNLSLGLILRLEASMKLNLSTYKPFAVLNTVSYRMIDWNSPVNCVNTPKDAFSSICYLTFVLMPFQTMYCKLGLLLQFPCICMKTDFNDWQLLLQTRKILTLWSTLIIMLQHLGELKKKKKKLWGA